MAQRKRKQPNKTRNLRRLFDELGIDLKGCVEAAYDLGQWRSGAEASLQYARMAAQTPSRREQQLRGELAKGIRRAEQLERVNRDLAALLMAEHRLIDAGWLPRLLRNATAANDTVMACRLRKMIEDLYAGGTRGRKRRAPGATGEAK